MSFAFLVAAFAATTNAPRVRLAGGRGVFLLAAPALLLAGAAPALVLADDLLAALDVSPESMRIAAGIVLAVSGARTLAVPRTTGRLSALVAPELAVLVVAVGADEPVGKAIGTLAVALALVPAAGVLRRDGSLAAAARLLAALQLVIAVALVVDGIRDV